MLSIHAIQIINLFALLAFWNSFFFSLSLSLSLSPPKMNTVENPYRNLLGGERLRELCSFCKFSRYPQATNKQSQFSKWSRPLHSRWTQANSELTSARERTDGTQAKLLLCAQFILLRTDYQRERNRKDVLVKISFKFCTINSKF